MPQVSFALFSPLKSGAISVVSPVEICSSGVVGSHVMAVLSSQKDQSGRRQLLTQRQCPRLALVRASCSFWGQYASIDLVAPGQPSFTVDLRLSQLSAREGVFNGDLIPCLDAGDKAAGWLAPFVGDADCRLLIRDFSGQRQTAWTHPDVKATIACQDGWPFTIVSLDSLWQVAYAAGKSGVSDIELIRRIRPTFLVDGIHCFKEDTWKKIRIMTVDGRWITFLVIKLRARCELPNVNPTTGEFDWVQPNRLVDVLVRMDRLLPEFPDNPNSKKVPALGIALALENPQERGTIAAGAEIEVLECW